MKKFLNNELSNLFKEERKKQGFTQSDIAEKLGISISKYNRIENGTAKKVDIKTIEKLKDILSLYDITGIEDINNPIKTMTLRLPYSLYKKLDFFRFNNDFNSFNSALLYCLEDYTTNLQLQNSKYELMNLIEDTILNTYVKTMTELKLETDNSRKLIEHLEKRYGIDIEKEKEIIKLNEINQKRAKV